MLDTTNNKEEADDDNGYAFSNSCGYRHDIGFIILCSRGGIFITTLREYGLHPYDWTDRVRMVWQGNIVSICTSRASSNSFGGI